MKEFRRHSSATNLRAQRIEKELQKRSIPPPPESEPLPPESKPEEAEK